MFLTSHIKKTVNLWWIWLFSFQENYHLYEILWYLQPIINGDTAVLNYATEFILMSGTNSNFHKLH